MLCEHKRSTLTEVAATNELSAALRAQLASCESCRAAFAEEQALFAAIDSGLHNAANAEVPHSLLPRLRAAIDEQSVAPLPRTLGWSSIVAAVAVAAVAIFLVRLPRAFAPPAVNTSAPHAASSPSSGQGVTSGASATTLTESTDSSRFPQFAARASILPVKSEAKHANEPQVIVPPDEREAYLRLVAALRQHDQIARALAAPQPANPQNASIAAAPLEIGKLEIKLIDQQLEQADSAGESGSGERLH